MSEALIQTGLQTTFQGMAEFENAEVVINDWTILDGSYEAIILIETADDFSSTQTAKIENNTISIKVYLFEKFTTWQTTLDNLTTHRDAILTTFNDSDTGARAAGSVEAASSAVNIEEIRSAAGVQPWYYHYVDPQDLVNAVPQYLWQLMIFVAREY